MARFVCDPNQIVSALLAFNYRRRDVHQVLTSSAQREKRAQRVGVAKFTTIVELSVISVVKC